MVSTSHPLATEAGMAVFRKGGNAVDALTARGHKIEAGPFYGRRQIIIRLEDGALCGGAEPRGGGAIMAF